MSDKKIYDITLLNSLIRRDNAKLLNKTNNIKNRETLIYFICWCGILYQKTFRLIDSCGAFCKQCTNKNSIAKMRKTKQEKITIDISIVSTHPDIANYWHPTKNGDLKPEQFTKGSHQEAWWICPIISECNCQHEYTSIIYNRINDECPYCSNKKICYHKSLAFIHYEIAKEWHPTKNYRKDCIEGEYFPGNQISPSEVSIGSSEEYWWLCKIPKCEELCEHIWKTRVSVRTGQKSGCPFCSGRQVCLHNSIVHTHPHIAKLFHPTKNGVIQVSSLAPKSNVKVWCLCNININHEWRTSVCHLTTDTGCSFCSNKTEGKLLEYLKKYYPEVITQFKLDCCKNKKHLPFDFYIHILKIIIELDGPQHFKQVSNWNSPQETIKNDIYKMQKAEAEGYKIIRIAQEDVYNATEEWLDENLLSEIQNEDRIPVFISIKEDLYDEHIKLYEYI